MANEEETVEEERTDGATVADVSPEDILGALDDDPADDEPLTGDDEQDIIGQTEDEAKGDAEAEAQETPETGEEPVTETPETQTEETKPDLVPMTVLHQGREVTVMVQNTPEAIAAVEATRVTASQLAPLQEKHLQALEELRTGQQPGGEQPAGAPEQPKFSQEEFETAMKPRVEAAIEAGTIEKDFYGEFPKAAAYGVWIFDAIQELSGGVGKIARQMLNETHDSEVEDFRSAVFGAMGEMAQANPQIYGDLADQEKRETYYEYVVGLNPTVGQLTGENCTKTLTAFYDAYKGEELRAAATAAANAISSDQEAERLRAGGAGGGGGGRSQPRSKHPDIDAVFSD